MKNIADFVNIKMNIPLYTFYVPSQLVKEKQKIQEIVIE